MRIFRSRPGPTPILRPLGGGADLSPTPTAPTGRPYPLVASLDFAVPTGESTSTKFTRYLTYGYNGLVYYSPSAPGWTSDLAAIAAAHGTEPINLQVSYKQHTTASLKAILDNLPDAWVPGFRYNYYQEPEDNLTTSSEQQAYRDTYVAAAATVRAHPKYATGKLQLPWIELAEYSLELLYVNGDSSRSPAKFTPPAADYGGILWSFFEYGERGNTQITRQTARITRAIADFAPGKPWALMAGCYTLEPIDGPFTTAQATAQASWLTQSFAQLKAAGCTGYAWYNVKFGTVGGASGEARVENNTQALSALQTIAAAGYTTEV